MIKQTSISIAYIVKELSKRQLVEKYYPGYNIEVTATADNYSKMKTRLSLKKPDIIILDHYFMPDDIHSLIKEIKADNPKIKLLLMGTHYPAEIAEGFIKSGADGYYDQDCFDGFENFTKTLQTIKDGATVILPSKNNRHVISQPPESFSYEKTLYNPAKISFLIRAGFKKIIPDKEDPHYYIYKRQLRSHSILEGLYLTVADGYITVWCRQDERGHVPGQSVMIASKKFTETNVEILLALLKCKCQENNKIKGKPAKSI